MRAQVYFHHCHTLSDARYAAAEGFEFIAFSIDPASPAFPGMGKLKEIAGWVSGPRLVGQFPEGTPVSVILDAIEFLGLEAVELQHPLSTSIKTNLSVPIIVSMPWEVAIHAVQPYLEEGKMVLLKSECSFDTLSQQPDAEVLSKLCQSNYLILDCSFQVETLRHALETWTPYGIALRGGEEEKPGLYNYEQLEALTEVLS